MLQLENEFLVSIDCQDSEKSEISELEEISDEEMISLPPIAIRKKTSFMQSLELSKSLNFVMANVTNVSNKRPIVNVAHSSTFSKKSTGSCSRQLSFSSSENSKTRDIFINNKLDNLEKQMADGFDKLYEKLSSKYERATEHLNKNILNLKEEVKILKKRDVSCLQIDSENLPELPIKSIEELNDMERVLESDYEKVILIFKMMNLAAGSSLRSVIHNIHSQMKSQFCTPNMAKGKNRSSSI